MDKLTPKQERFCLNIFQGMSQREAWIQAGYSSKYPMSVVDSNACRMAAESKIQARIQELKQKAEDASVATVLERKQILSQIVRAMIPDYIEDGEVKLEKNSPNVSAVAEIETRAKMGKQGPVSITKFKLHNPIQAINELNKMDNVYSETNIVNDNRQINIIVQNSETKELLSKIGDRLIDISNS